MNAHDATILYDELQEKLIQAEIHIKNNASSNQATTFQPLLMLPKLGPHIHCILLPLMFYYLHPHNVLMFVHVSGVVLRAIMPLNAPPSNKLILPSNILSLLMQTELT